MRNIAGLACLCVLWTAAAVLAAGPAERHAVVIGINDYADPAIGDLKYAESDAGAVYGTLTDPKVGKFPKENVTLILGAQATPSAIKAALYGLRGVDKNDLVVIFYSGHGAKEGDEAFWVTQNAQAKALPATALSNTDIRKYLAQIPSQKLVTFLDCCYAASTVKKSFGDPTKLFGDFAGKGRVTIAGSADSQEALEMPEAKAGVFTHFLVQALSGQADTNADGAVTFEEVWGYLGENVRKASVKQGGLHEPVIISDSGFTPQFLLTFNPTAKAANNKSLAALRKLFDESKITGAQYDVGLKALTEPAIDTASRTRREVFADLTAGRLSPKYLQDILNRRLKEAQTPVKPPAGKPTLAVAPFRVFGSVPGKDAGRILAERLLPMFAAKYQLIDQAQLARFCAQDDLTLAGLVEHLQRPTTKGLSKAVKLRAVQYLLVGTITGSPDGTLSVTARICDWQRGTAVGNRFAQVRAESWSELENRMALLAGRLLGDLTAIDTGADPTLPGLPAGVDKITARIQQFQAIAAELKKARTLYTDKHPRVVKLAEAMKALGKPLASDIVPKLDELWAADTKLAALYKEAHPQRQALSEQIAFLRKAYGNLLVVTGKVFTLDLGNKVSMKLVLIPAGKFLMGSPETEKGHESSEGPQREVTISKPFYMGVYEVTQEQYEAVMGKNPSTFKGAANPAETVSWEDAVAFCQALSRKTGKMVSLPTEAQWEYACRAGSKTRFSFGDSDADLYRYGNYCDKSNTSGYMRRDKDHNDGHDKTAPVGSFRPNAFGLYDMHGNVSEWCNDWYAVSYANAKNQDPQGPDSASYPSCRVFRGGSSYDKPAGCRSAYRGAFMMGERIEGDLGFRVSVDLKESLTRPPSLPSKLTGTPVAAPVAEPPAKHKKELTLDLGKNVSMKLVLIPAGKFLMGSSKAEQAKAGEEIKRILKSDKSPEELCADEGPSREVTLTRPFYMGVHEVTQEQYEGVIGSNPSRFKGAKNPVDTVSWEDAVAFCQALSRKTGKTVRLPTEAQWEYACRAGSKTRFGFGDNDADLGNYAWFDQNSGRKTHSVGGKKPNAFGLYDTHGNVWEWCSDWYAESYANAKTLDPTGPGSGPGRVLRGGSWQERGSAKAPG